MRFGMTRVLVIVVAGLALAGCNTLGMPSNPFATSETPGADANASADASVKPDGTEANAMASPDMEAADKRLLGADPNDDLSLGKKQYRAKNYGVAEKHFRRAVESHPRDAEAWMGLAASYDRLRRFELADRAYNQAIGIMGPTAEILNNQGYSYMLRGDYKHAREKLDAALHKDPGNKYVQNNMQLLEDSYRKGKAIQ